MNDVEIIEDDFILFDDEENEEVIENENDLEKTINLFEVVEEVKEELGEDNE